ncbi:MAG: hypothetical protein MUF76_15885 [Hydrogenophaga sp.]|nr:hypothetical protein [Hydrogenophaga sp.]
MPNRPHVIAWCEIPVHDFERARVFYAAVLGHPIETMTMGPSTMGFLSSDPDQVSGAIVHGDGTAPSQSGTLVYLNGGDDLAVMLARVEPAGARWPYPRPRSATASASLPTSSTPKATGWGCIRWPDGTARSPAAKGR